MVKKVSQQRCFLGSQGWTCCTCLRQIAQTWCGYRVTRAGSRLGRLETPGLPCGMDRMA